MRAALRVNEKAVKALPWVYMLPERGYGARQILCQTPKETAEGKGLIAPLTISGSIHPETQTKTNPASVLLSFGGMEATKHGSRMKQEIFHLPPRLSAMPRCAVLPEGAGKGFGAEGFDFSEVAKPSLHSGQPLAPQGNARGFQPRLSEVQDVMASRFSVPQFPLAVEQRR